MTTTHTLTTLALAIALHAPALTQPFFLPALDSLRISVDRYYTAATSAQLEELKLTRRYRWVNYLPNPGFNPFTGGFSIQFNLAAPLAEFKLNEAAKQKAAAILRLNQLEAAKTKNAVDAAHESIRHAVQEFEAQDSLVYYKQVAFQLAQTQYDRREMTPSEFLGRQQDKQNFLLQRLRQANQIKESIRQLLLLAHYPVHTLQNQPTHDKGAITANADGGADH